MRAFDRRDGSAMGVRLGSRVLSRAELDAARQHVHRLAKRSGSSFYWAMRLLPPEKREAMFAIYGFCREVDDIADDSGSMAEKLAALTAWRDEIDGLYDGRPTRPTSMALLMPIQHFDLPKNEFLTMIDGMEMDAGETIYAPSLPELERYCRAVAGSAGLLSMSVFGQRGRDLDRGAIALGEALQLTNILRDIDEDARRGRIYLPRELLTQYGIPPEPALGAIMHPALNGVCRALASRAEKCFALAQRLLAKGDKEKLRPALIMMQVYRRLLAKLTRNDWQRLDRRVKVGKLEKLWIAIRYGWR
jgi:presqualene diphosphate synthase